MEENLIRLDTINDNIYHITLNRPQQLNALNIDVLTLLNNYIEQADSNKKIKGVIITGEGKAFCAGADIKGLQLLKGPKAYEFANYGQKVFNRIELLSKPSIAAINGIALGGGCELAMACTMRLATSQAMFAQPEINLGIIPGYGGTQRLSRLIGKTKALEICLTGKKFSAKEALRWGFLNDITSHNNLIPKAIEIMQNIINKSSSAIKAILETINLGYEMPLDKALALEAKYFAMCCDTEDKEEGVNAFLEKRTPQFKET